LIGAPGAITQFLRLTFLRPIERFLAQVISISTEPSAFVRERIHLGDTTNFLRAAGFFVSAISTAFLAEVATLYLLRIGNLTEPYYWLFILLTSIPFVVIGSLLVRLVAPLGEPVGCRMGSFGGELTQDKKKPPGRGFSLGAQVWGVINRKPRLGARGFHSSRLGVGPGGVLTQSANRNRDQMFR